MQFKESKIQFCHAVRGVFMMLYKRGEEGTVFNKQLRS